MAGQHFGEICLTADLSPNLRVYQPVIFSKSRVLLACRTRFIYYNNPAFTNITLKMYSNNPATDTPDVLIHSSTTTWTKAQKLTLTNGVNETYFEWSQVNVRAGETYHFIPVATGYTGTNSSHIAWRKAWPDPQYRTNVDLVSGGLGISPFEIYFITAPL